MTLLIFNTVKKLYNNLMVYYMNENKITDRHAMLDNKDSPNYPYLKSNKKY